MSERWKNHCKALIELLPDGVFFCDRQGRILYANKVFQSLFGSVTALDSALLSSVHPDDCKSIEVFLQRLILHTQQNDIVQVRMRGEDGCLKWIELSSVAIETEEGAFGVLRDVTRYKTLQQELLLQALTDELTALYNRRGFKMMAEQELKHSHRLKHEAILLSIDIDAFKAINDTYGHDEGDRVLRFVAQTMKQCFRSSDILCRWGGDEFLVLALDAPGFAVDVMAERFKAMLRQTSKDKDLPYMLSVTIGYAYQGEKSNLTLAQMIQRADSEMYENKKR
ncbi:MAG: diguanylate cyclase [Spirochaetia bacterium]|nr:diguanylate cyclase [Spirochaetia bacterium]